MPDTDHDLYRAQLARLSDSDLLEWCVTEKRLTRHTRKPDRRCLDQLWFECCRRNRPDLFAAALEVIRQEERERQAAIQRATEELT